MSELAEVSGEKDNRRRYAPWDVVKSGLERLGNYRLQKALGRIVRKIEPGHVYTSSLLDGLTEVYRIDQANYTSVTVSVPSPRGTYARTLSVTAEATGYGFFGRIGATMTECSYDPDDMGTTTTFNSLDPSEANTLPRAEVAKMLRQIDNTPLVQTS